MKFLAIRPLVLWFVLITPAVFPPLSAQSSGKGVPRVARPGTLRGQIRLPSGAAGPAGILILVENETGAEVARLMTDSRGKFELADLPPGIYYARVHQNGYGDSYQRVDLNISPFGFANLELRPTISSTTSPTVPPEGPGAFVSAKGPQTNGGRQELEKAQALLFEKRNAEGSLKHLRNLLKTEPQYAQGHRLMGTALMQLQQYDKAETELQDAVRLDPKDSTALFELGVCLNQLGRFSGAEKPLLQSLELNPSSVGSHYELARTYFGLGSWQQAEPHAMTAIRLQSDFPPAHVLLGNIYLKKRDATSALTEFETYLRLDPNGPFAKPTTELVDKIKRALASSQDQRDRD